jgi:hypothetical protein
MYQITSKPSALSIDGFFSRAQGIEAEIPQTRRRRVEELERIARFAARSAANAPKS